MNLKKKRLSISAFFPCYNDAGSIAMLVKDAETVLGDVANDYEIIVVDDGSKDESRALLKRLRLEIPSLKLVFHKKNLGYGGSLRTGFNKASKDWIFYTDGDGQYDVGDLRKFIPKISAYVDIIQGFKLRRSDPWYRLIVGKIYYYISRFLFNIKIKDVDCDFRLIKRVALDSIKLEYNSGVICVELIKKLQDKGARFVEIGVNHYPRLYGHSQYFNYKRIAKTIYELTELRLKLFFN